VGFPHKDRFLGYSLSAGLTLLSLGIADRAMALSFISDYSSEYEEYIGDIVEESVSEEIVSGDIRLLAEVGQQAIDNGQ
jgi:hypothetical protein